MGRLVDIALGLAIAVVVSWVALLIALAVGRPKGWPCWGWPRTPRCRAGSGSGSGW